MCGIVLQPLALRNLKQETCPDPKSLGRNTIRALYFPLNGTSNLDVYMYILSHRSTDHVTFSTLLTHVHGSLSAILAELRSTRISWSLRLTLESVLALHMPCDPIIILAAFRRCTVKEMRNDYKAFLHYRDRTCIQLAVDPS